jgi:hypothetical protein
VRWYGRIDVSLTARVVAAAVTGIVAASAVACGAHSVASPTSNRPFESISPPSRSPLPSGPGASAPLCNIFFGSTHDVAKQFGFRPLTLAGGVASGVYWLMCTYRPVVGQSYPEFVLTIGTSPPGTGTPLCIHETSAHAPKLPIVATAQASCGYGFPKSTDVWLLRAAARATLPTGSQQPGGGKIG